MAFKRSPRVAEFATGTSADLSTTGAYDSTFRAFSSVCSNGDTFEGVIVSTSGQWERGLYTYSAANTITRTTVTDNSSGTAPTKIVFTGVLTVFLDIPLVNEEVALASSSGQLLHNNGGALIGEAGYTLNVGGTHKLLVLSRATKATGQVGITLVGGTSGMNWQIIQDTSSDALSFYTGGGTPGTRVAFGDSGSGVSASFYDAVTITASGKQGTLVLTDTGVNGANLRFVGDGGTTPNKTLRSNGGQFQIANDAYNAVILSLTDGGDLSVIGSVLAGSGLANKLSMVGAATTIAPYLQVTGTDTNISLNLTTKGSGGYGFFTNALAQAQFAISHTASAVNYLNVTGAATTFAPTLSAAGTDSNIDIVYAPKGTGVNKTTSAYTINIATGTTTSTDGLTLATSSVAADATTTKYSPRLRFSAAGWSSFIPHNVTIVSDIELRPQTGSGANGQRSYLKFKIGSSDVLSIDNFHVIGDAARLYLSGGTQGTTDVGWQESAVGIDTTWDDGGSDYVLYGIKLDVADTSSAAGSPLMDLRLGGASKFKVAKTGYAVSAGMTADISETYKLAADTGALGAAIADIFPSGTATLEAATWYEVTWELYFLKSTAGTVTFTFTSANAPQLLNMQFTGGPNAGMAAVGTVTSAGIEGSTSAAAALPVTGSLTTGVMHHFTVRAIFLSHATTAGTHKLRATMSAGTITIQAGSYVTFRKMPTANNAIFA